MDQLVLQMGVELADEDDFAFLYIARADTNHETVETGELDSFTTEHGLGIDRCLVLDGDSATVGPAEYQKFLTANPTLTVSEGIPMIIDKEMKIRAISGTTDWAEYPLTTIQECLAE